MKNNLKLILFLFLSSAFVNCFGQYQYDWYRTSVTRIGRDSTLGSVEALGMTKDHGGNLIMSAFDGPDSIICLGRDTFVNPNYSVRAGFSFLVKFDTLGNQLWCKFFTSTLFENLATDANDNIYMSATDNGSDVIIDTDTLHSFGGGSAIFLIKLNSSGHLVWSKRIDSTTDMLGQNMDVDANSNVYFLGSTFYDSVHIGDYLVRHHRSYYSSVQDAFVVKMDSSGDIKWVKEISGPAQYIIPFCLNVDANFNVLIGCQYVENSTTLIPDSVFYDSSFVISPYHDALRNYECFFAKVDSNGRLIWAKMTSDTTRSVLSGTGAGTFTAFPFSCVGDKHNCSYFAGSFGAHKLMIDSFTLVNDSETNLDHFLIKMDPSGTVVWAKRFGGIKDDEITTIQYDSIRDQIWVAGKLVSIESHFGNDTITRLDSNYVCDFGKDGGFIAQFDTGGVLRNIFLVNFGGDDGVYLKVGPDGSLYYSGDYANFSGERAIWGRDSLLWQFGENFFLSKIKRIDTTHGTHILNSSITSGNVEIFPNPTVDKFQLLGANNCEVNIFTLLGKSVWYSKRYIDFQQIDLSFVSKGTYLVVVKNLNTGEFITKRLIYD